MRIFSLLYDAIYYAIDTNIRYISVLDRPFINTMIENNHKINQYEIKKKPWYAVPSMALIDLQNAKKCPICGTSPCKVNVDMSFFEMNHV